MAGRKAGASCVMAGRTGHLQQSQHMNITITSDIWIEGKYFAAGTQTEVPFRLAQNLIGMDVAKETKAPVEPVIPDEGGEGNEKEGDKDPDDSKDPAADQKTPSLVKKSKLP